MKRSDIKYLPISLIGAAFLLAGVFVSTNAAADAPIDPDTFLTFLERHAAEDSASSTAYYAAVDPDGKKKNYGDWLFETGFISNRNDYFSTGSFSFDRNAGVTTVTHKNETDLGFIRVVSIRCEPKCDDPNPDIYSVIENYPSFEDAELRTNRLASVTMEWTSAINGSSPSNKFVVFYAYTGGDSRNVKNLAGKDIPFAPDLDGRGTKEIPGLCNTCHGGAPRPLNSDGSYAENGNTGSLFLAMDLDNFGFDPDIPSLSEDAQQAAYKTMNQAVLITHRGTLKTDEITGDKRLPAGHEMIEGWYGGAGMPNNTFDGTFIPEGWDLTQETRDLYHDTIVPACRACHVQQEMALDFATYEGFMVFEDAHKELVLRIECGLDDDSKNRNNKADDQGIMPLAKLTYEIFWGANPDQGNSRGRDLKQVGTLKEHLGIESCDDF